MKERSFYDTEQHSKKHEGFTNTMLSLDSEASDLQSVLLSIEVLMKIWMEHILNDDKTIGDHALELVRRASGRALVTGQWGLLCEIACGI